MGILGDHRRARLSNPPVPGPAAQEVKIRTVVTRIEELEAEKRDLEERRKRLEIPTINQEMLSGLLDNFEEVMVVGTNPQTEGPSSPPGEEGPHS